MSKIKTSLNSLAAKLLGKLRLKIHRLDRSSRTLPIELSPEDGEILDFVLTNKLSMASHERLYMTIMSCLHVIDQGVEGDFVECGVWRGGNSILAADVFRRRARGRLTYLFDTFAGMTKPTDMDVDCLGEPAMEEFQKLQRETFNEWCHASLQDVKLNFEKAGLAVELARFVQGDVLDTLLRPSELPHRISVLRLDTDWYESTKLELEVLYPLLSEGGILIIDDYGHWGGARKAVEEYFATRPKPFLQYTDYTGRVGVKLSH